MAGFDYSIDYLYEKLTILSMGMHEYEDLVERSIRFLDSIDGLEFISLFKSLYAFQSNFDTGNTKTRIADILIKRKFASDVSLAETKETIAAPTVDPVEIATIIAIHANEESPDDRQLVAWWYAVIPTAILAGASSLELRSAQNDRSIQTFRDSVIKLESFKIKCDYGDLRYPEPDDLAEFPSAGVEFMRWWFSPVWNSQI